eukprot:TRINITY_DN5_c0_g1_i1.p1 TRINITY_DN5_c0_g1~~TRINITY_DN5_c0_g1_i1.p1  ORF type:complete len:716 (+),score=136.43 TRINITY_DN5_c0_g1_i1:956-3103(+)
MTCLASEVGYIIAGSGSETGYAVADLPSEHSLYDTCKWSHGASQGGEAGRYAALESLGMLDTDPEAPFDRITKCMTEIFQTPVSLITLVADPSRVWFKSRVGPFGSCVDRDGSWCNYILTPTTSEILITEDASVDARFAHNPYVAGDPHIKFYAGAPLIGSEGERYGTLCIVDLVQRAFTAENYAMLNNFAALAVEELERNKPLTMTAENAIKNDIQNARFMDMSLKASKDGILMLDLREEGWPIVYVNPAFEKSAGSKFEHGDKFWDLVDSTTPKAEFAAAAGRGESFEIFVTCKESGLCLKLRLMPSATDRLAPSKATGIPSWVPSAEAPEGTKLGVEVDLDKVVDIRDRDKDRVPDTKCFWFVMIFETSSDGPDVSTTSGSGSGSTLTSSEGSGSSFGDFTAPAELGQLKFGPLLGSGSFGKVYRGMKDNECAVAIKVIDCRGRGAGATSKQLEEVKLGSSLDHPLVVKVLCHGTSMEMAGHKPIKVAWIVQELCDLSTLSSACERGWLRVNRSMKAPPDMLSVIFTMRDIAEAMAYVHSRSIIHADLTGRNVLLASSASDPRGFVAKICDFGLAQKSQGEPFATNILGTISHMPPELLEKVELSPEADVWAFAVVAWEAVHGKCAFKGMLAPQIVLTVVHGKLPLQWREDISADFQGLMKRCLNYNCKLRPRFTAIQENLERQARGETTISPGMLSKFASLVLCPSRLHKT